MVDKELVDELVRLVILKLKKRNIDSSEFIIQKVIFKLKMMLGENHLLYKHLPYYWYNSGPVSSVVSEAIENILNNDNFPLGTLADDVDEAVDSILNNYNIKEIEKVIYREFAPYDFMYDYRYKIFELARNETSAQNIDKKELYELMRECLVNLPSGDYFNKFSLVFTRTMSIIRLLRNKPQFDDFWGDIRCILQEIWFTFTCGLRVCQRDDYYKSCDAWDLEFKDKLKILRENVFTFYFNVIDSDIEVEYSPFTDFEKKLIEGTYGQYTEGGFYE